MPGQVTCIPATRNRFTAQPINAVTKRRVAAYARVSTDSEEQLTSYEAQIDYYTNFIKSHPEWEFVKVYTDEGISALNTNHREGFNQMIADAMDGKIDLIIAKSVSRFARNTVDSLSTIRKLKDKGTEVYFQKEGIYTFDGKGELLITIMSSLAQEESRSISENVKWGIRKRFADGKVVMPYSSFLGYEKGPDGKPVVNEKEAVVVRRIYRLFIEGKTIGGIARTLEASGIPTPSGKGKWSLSTIKSILTNERYKGDALLQKSFTVDFLTKQMKPNEGEVPSYYVENSHPAIISREEFDAVQSEFERRNREGNGGSGKIFSSKLLCADCGGIYGPKVWASNTKHRRVIWQCNHKFKTNNHCRTPNLTEEEIKAKFVAAYNDLVSDRGKLIEDCRLMENALTDTTQIGAELDKVRQEIDEIIECAHRIQPQDAYEARYADLIARYEKASMEQNRLEIELAERKRKTSSMGIFLEQIKKSPASIADWDDSLWALLVENAVVKRDGSIVFRFRNGEVVVG